MTSGIRIALAMGLVLVMAVPFAAQASELALLPGRLVGTIHQLRLPRGWSIGWLATTYGVNPVRILKPSRKALRDGLQRGEWLTLDQRRIEPRFPSGRSGIVLNIPEAQLYFLQQGAVVKDYPVGVSRSDWQAPIGSFRVVHMEKNPKWVVPDSIQKEMEAAGREVIKEVEAGPGNPLGARWIGFAGGSFGIHGTLAPMSIKQYASHGCVRMLNGHLLDLYGRVSVGTPVHVVYQPVLLAAEGGHVWLSAYPDVYGRTPNTQGLVRELAVTAGVLGQIDWKRVQRALRDADGILVDVARAPLTRPTPPPRRSPIPTPSPSGTRAAPSVGPSAAPGSDRMPMPSPLLSPSPMSPPSVSPSGSPAATPAPAPVHPVPATTASPSLPSPSPRLGPDPEGTVRPL